MRMLLNVHPVSYYHYVKEGKIVIPPILFTLLWMLCVCPILVKLIRGFSVIVVLDGFSKMVVSLHKSLRYKQMENCLILLFFLSQVSVKGGELKGEGRQSKNLFSAVKRLLSCSSLSGFQSVPTLYPAYLPRFKISLAGTHIHREPGLIAASGPHLRTVHRRKYIPDG